jgi:hypothetical protein
LGSKKCKEYLNKYLSYLDDETYFFEDINKVVKSNSLYDCECFGTLYNFGDMFYHVKFQPHTPYKHQMKDELIENDEDYNFIIFVCIFDEIHICITANAYYDNKHNKYYKLSSVGIEDSYMYNADEISMIDGNKFGTILEYAENAYYNFDV